MKKKGFTLIELLAVIVILAIIAVIATPLILGVIETSKKGAAKSSAFGYIDAVEKQSAIGMISNEELLDGTYDVMELEVSYKGEKIKEGTINAINGIVEKALLKVNDYYACYSDNEVTIDKDQTKLTECSDMIIVELVGDPILEKAKSLVYDENGVCKTDGTTYTYMNGCYIKGNSNNNYVWYNGFMWRIMGINSDKTVRLITDENVTAIPYGASNSGLTYVTNEGYIHDWLNEFFYENLNSTKNIIKEGAYFCSELATIPKTARQTCNENSEVTSKIGLMSADEYNLSLTNNSYLNIAQTSTTMTPYSDSDFLYLGGDGNTWYGCGVTGLGGIRPIINVSSDAIVTTGDGSISKFYLLGEYKPSNVTGTIGKKATSGEYVKLDGKTYRVVRKTTDGVKLILDGFYEEEGITYTMEYGNNDKFVLDSGIGAKLNGDVFSWLVPNSQDKIVKTKYYQGDGFAEGTPYTEMLKESNALESKVGLIQIGDILASQSATIITKNYTVPSSYNNTNLFWSINKNAVTTKVWAIDNNGNSYASDITNKLAIRPVITVKSDLKINGGNGTWISPYEI